jgi:hypothetical protein
MRCTLLLGRTHGTLLCFHYRTRGSADVNKLQRASNSNLCTFHYIICTHNSWHHY